MIQRFFFAVVTNQKFDIFIMIIILLNMIVMGLEHYEQSEDFDYALYVINTAFIVIFTGECVLKLLSLRLHFFKDLQSPSALLQAPESTVALLQAVECLRLHFFKLLSLRLHFFKDLESPTALLQAGLERVRLRRRRRLCSRSVPIPLSHKLPEWHTSRLT